MPQYIINPIFHAKDYESFSGNYFIITSEITSDACSLILSNDTKSSAWAPFQTKKFCDFYTSRWTLDFGLTYYITYDVRINTDDWYCISMSEAIGTPAGNLCIDSKRYDT